MIQTGIFTGYFPYSLEESAQRIRAQGFNTVQLDLAFKDMDFQTPDSITSDKCRHVRDTFRRHDLPVSCVSAYTNIVHPDPGERRKRNAYLKAILRHARDCGSPYVISETGTVNPDSDWSSHPDNKSERAYEDCVKIVREIAQEAYDHGAMFLVETYVNNIIGSIEETSRLFADVDHPGLGLLMDPTNYFEAHNIDRMDQVLNQMFDVLSDKIKIAHAKDVKRSSSDDKGEKFAAIDASEAHQFRGVGAIELPAPGLGSLNYILYLKRLARQHPNIPIIIEHLDESDVPRAKEFLDRKLIDAGV
ncbi:sugar phosphate isomerase/epimerase family protein [Verminephrobacter eiseniae]|uniref:Xylose isomerase domain protein TIM barrel n=1 Tax=Verminephrobacter eiseniae (strain EF01-2) TaxID=391735 RepID=A1WNE8_VEREI|nr:sugar phosphate isomerase/epimerase [Verminephrobacter eiseniae]ABM59155.1 Xylose isomerase domain protein TIM barrel [Verminephrobacter eiseniae EF01-2]MCW5284701.1 sugar phosphate isomerase/epimerase [Verminephrobacter eiseniae]MCW5302407.1 sugar phosphate isomerase/epimerase [Verminephrobacter eiseniae]MCW8180562.1 sugar phosphate isomerase/epimerase [Verminephrobacter eiseniae]MCW8189228.1 sugar phosphate isomerase/epimerase [Verminephrobacter eiseniae]